jgi:hypothetical protein
LIDVAISEPSTWKPKGFLRNTECKFFIETVTSVEMKNHVTVATFDDVILKRNV